MMLTLPQPKNIPAANSPGSSILYGISEDDDSKWKMNHVSCRTSFDPVLNGTLKEIIISGKADDIDLMLPKSQMIYTDGWVLDYGEGEKRANTRGA